MYAYLHLLQFQLPGLSETQPSRPESSLVSMSLLGSSRSKTRQVEATLSEKGFGWDGRRHGKGGGDEPVSSFWWTHPAAQAIRVDGRGRGTGSRRRPVGELRAIPSGDESPPEPGDAAWGFWLIGYGMDV